MEVEGCKGGGLEGEGWRGLGTYGEGLGSCGGGQRLGEAAVTAHVLAEEERRAGGGPGRRGV